MRARLGRWHRLAAWIGGAQLLVWIGTGFAFSWFDFAAVRGTGDRAPPPAIEWHYVRVTPEAAAPGAHTIVLRPLVDRAVYVVDDERLIDAADGKALSVDAALAQAIARAAHVGTTAVRAVAPATASDPDIALPAWRVQLDDRAQTVVFVAQRTGEIIGWRNASWRRFDRLWSLHVLGYVSRDHPAHAAMRVVSALALAIALTGVALLLGARRRRPRA
jgi:uncharacterized iron-regulated membrane protein